MLCLNLIEKMIIVRIKGGLGNQMFQYAIAKSIAIYTNDIFKLDLSFYPNQDLRKFELNLFNIEENIASSKECDLLRGREGVLLKISEKFNLPLVKRPNSYYKGKENTVFYPNVFKYMEGAYLDGYWQNEKYFSAIRKGLINDFTLKNKIGENATNFLKNIKNTNSVSVHIRRGDYLGNKYYGVCDINYFKKAMKKIDENIKNPVCFIFSDDIDWCKDNFNHDNNIVFVDNTESALEDLELMKHCKHNIIANSSFSWWGAWLNQNKDKIVISPLHWKKSNPKNLKWVPETWKQI